MTLSEVLIYVGLLVVASLSLWRLLSHADFREPYNTAARVALSIAALALFVWLVCQLR